MGLLRTRLLCLLVVVVAACEAVAPSGSPAATGSVASPAVERSAEDVMGILAEAGIAVVESVTADDPLVDVAEPRSPITLTRWQLTNLVTDANRGGALPGSQLDELGVLAGLPADVPPISYFVAGWVSGFDSPAARRARDLMGERDWHHPESIGFPHLVLTLFVADMAAAPPARAARAGRAARATPAAEGAPLRLVAPATWSPAEGRSHTSLAGIGGAPDPFGIAQAGVSSCPLTGWVDSVLGALFEQLQVEEDGGGVLGTIAVVWNYALALAQEVISGLIEILTAPVLKSIRTAVAVIGTLTYMATLIKGYDIDVEQTGATHFTHAGEPAGNGEFFFVVEAGLTGWPDYLIDCARDAGINLPSTNPSGNPVRWITWSDGGLPVAAVVSKSEVVAEDDTIRLQYAPGNEAPLESPTVISGGAFHVGLHVKLFEDAALDQLTKTIVWDGIAGEILAQLVGPLFAEAKSRIQFALEQQAGGHVGIGYHVPEPTPTPTPTATPSPTPTLTPRPSGTARPTAAPGPATADVIYGGGFRRFTGGYCISREVDGGHSWQLFFPGATPDVFSIHLLDGAPIGGRSYVDPQFITASLVISAVDFGDNLHIDVLTIEPGAGAGSFHGRYDAERQTITGTFTC